LIEYDFFVPNAGIVFASGRHTEISRDFCIIYDVTGNAKILSKQTWHDWLLAAF